MSFASRLTHTVTIERPGEIDPIDAEDEYGQPVPTSPTTETVKAAIQPKTEREIALTTQQGAALSDHTIFLLPVDVTTGDAIVHEAQDCPMRPDLPDGRFEITGVPDAAGLGHHLELDCRRVEAVGQAGS